MCEFKTFLTTTAIQPLHQVYSVLDIFYFHFHFFSVIHQDNIELQMQATVGKDTSSFQSLVCFLIVCLKYTHHSPSKNHCTNSLKDTCITLTQLLPSVTFCDSSSRGNFSIMLQLHKALVIPWLTLKFLQMHQH